MLPDWPPTDYKYDLNSRQLRLVDAEKWNFEPEFDKSGLRKVTEVEAYPGLYQDSEGKIHDLRPLDT